MSVPQACSAFDQELETIQEFFQRFSCQMSEALHKVRNDDSKRANILLRHLPVAVISELQRRIAPVQLADASFVQIEEHLIQQFSTTKSTIGASVQFLTCRQQQGQTLEDYSRKLNNLASVCNYPADCLDRLLRDTFVAGLVSSSILTPLIQECDQLTFRETIERAKLLETFRRDAEKINSSRDKVYTSVEDGSSGDINKLQSEKSVPKESYLCYRCGAKGKHFSNDCFAKTRICHNCNKTGHLARICQLRKKNNISERSVHQLSSCSQMDDDNVHSLQHFNGTHRSSSHGGSAHNPIQPDHSCCLARRPRGSSSPTQGATCNSSTLNNNYDDSYLG